MDDEEVFIWDYPEPDRARLILRKAREEEEAIEEFEPIELDDDEEMEPLSPLCQYPVRNRMMDEFTNFTSFGVEAIWASVCACSGRRTASWAETKVERQWIICFT